MISIKANGNFGNNVFQNILASIFSKKNNLKVENYICEFQCNLIGADLYKEGHIYHENKVIINDNNFLDYLKNEKIETGLHIDGYFQSKHFVLNYKNEILSNFNLNYNINSNEDVFLHIRLGDTSHLNVGIDYYENALKHIGEFDKGYISSDSPDHEIVKTLTRKYNLIQYIDTPTNTINFGKTFKNIIISKGTFSFWIAMLSKAKKIIYPIGGHSWDGDIRIFPEWTGINI